MCKMSANLDDIRDAGSIFSLSGRNFVSHSYDIVAPIKYVGGILKRDQTYVIPYRYPNGGSYKFQTIWLRFVAYIRPPFWGWYKRNHTVIDYIYWSDIS